MSTAKPDGKGTKQSIRRVARTTPTKYTVTIVGKIPDDISDRISKVHAMALEAYARKKSLSVFTE